MASNTVAVRFTGEGAGLQGVLGELDEKMGGFGSKIAAAAGPAGLAIAGVASAAVGVGAGLAELGEKFHEQFTKIQVATGDTGTKLKGLEGDFKSTMASVPDSMGKVGDAVSEVAAKLDLTGKPLQEVSRQFLDLSRVTGTDLKTNMDAGTQALQNWNIQAKYQSSSMDELYAVSQKAGISFSDLAGQMGTSGLTLRGLGLDFEASTTLLGSLAKAGIDASTVMPGLSKAVASAAKEGKPANQVWTDLVHTIQNAPTPMAAMKAAVEVLGAKAGPKLAEAIREGKLSIDQIAQAAYAGDSTIAGSAKQAETFGEKWQTIKNRVLVDLEPVATKVFNALGTAMDKLGPIIDNDVVPAFQAISAWWQQNGPGIEAFVSQVFGAIEAVISTVVGIIEALWRTFGSTIQTEVIARFNAIKQIIQGVMEEIHGVIDVITGLIHGDWGKVWDGIKEIFGGAWSAMLGMVKDVLATIHAVISAAWIVIKGVFSGALDAIKSTVSSALSGVVGFFKNLPGQITSAVSGFGKLLVSAGEDLIKGLINGVKNMAGKAVDAVKNVGKDIVGAAKSVLKVFSPSQVFHEIGENLLHGLANGIDAQASPIIRQVEALAQQIIDSFQSNAGDLGVALGVSGSPLSPQAATRAAAGRDIAGNLARAAAARGGLTSGASGSLVLSVDPTANVMGQFLQLLLPYIRAELQLDRQRNGPVQVAVGF